MARRPVFIPTDDVPFVVERAVEFEYHPGFSVQQKQRSIASLHGSFLADWPGRKVLEVSSKSTVGLGIQLSAFNLMIHAIDDAQCSVEAAFQAAKKFENGGPYADLTQASSRQAKRDQRLQQSGRLIGFEFFGRRFPLEPRTYFYDWLYASALCGDEELLKQVTEYSAFTDIEFNPKRSMNCQARSVAKVVGLWQADELTAALESPESFLAIGFGAA
ncbi:MULTISPECIES: hypothetical protein [unclassified Actinobaculum]|uniref:DarT1-associated NADAR antitoxin family protein n=1 Tax=unclassified Actinobaculum TaxID=2609299 RepID=UPI000D5279D1|nr:MULTISPECIES: hypothetical protein [unclassified Actinobaculum]AWE42171.1 hypothetical protein DDD63_04725 [Actinobaculum sp. 313]RTE50731.1 hypothetical protein EKN07_00880 [Actinobaculum sp. 352]